MSNTYQYHDLADLSPEELFLWIAIDQTLDQLGGVDIAAAAAILSGQPFLPTRGKFSGATRGTSIASVVSRKMLQQRMPFALPTLTGASLRTLRLTFTRSLGAFVGRLVPGVGWTVLAYDVFQIINQSITKYNALAKKEDRLW
ncbi:STM2901 family protein [Acidovorax sp. NCPPB 3576]|uniref:STM2901 family protein n=1 Tax=Acidovorax sp. NCPPB 3576 TaxID=2940488 RepID=UPI003FA4282E